MVVGIFILGISTILTGINFIATTHMLRARGMRWTQIPLFVWTIYGTSVIMLLATPVLGMSLILVGLDHGLRLGIFDPAVGGDPVLFEHIFWFYSHPAVYIMILPAMGVISEVVPTFAHRRPSSYTAIAISTLGIAFVGFFTWGHHMFVAGMSTYDAGVFGILSMFVAIFSAIKVFTWTATLYKGHITFSTPLLYFFAFLFLFIFGGMTGVAVATQSLDVHWTDTYFVVAHFHFIMVGGSVTAFLAAAHYWFPKMFGKLYSERVGLLSAVGGLPRLRSHLPAAVPAGERGDAAALLLLPAPVPVAPRAFNGGCLPAGGRRAPEPRQPGGRAQVGEKAPANPWGSRGFEWLTQSPPPTHNFSAPPVLDYSPYDYTLTDEEARARAGQ